MIVKELRELDKGDDNSQNLEIFLQKFFREHYDNERIDNQN